MKKRSLFAAVAMLIVSAIVLTSSTYAWFSSQAKANVNQVTANIVAGDVGNVQVQTGSTSWKSSLSNSELGGNFTGLLPVDYYPKTTTDTEKTLTYDGMYFTNVTAPDSTLIKSYSWNVKAMQADNTKKIKIPVTFGLNSGSTNNPCLCGAIVVDASGSSPTTYTFGSGSGYNTLGTITAATESGTANGIIDTGEFADTEAFGTTVTFDNPSEIYITSNIATAHTIDCYLWVEGQHPACTGSTVDITGGFTFSNIELVNA